MSKELLYLTMLNILNLMPATLIVNSTGYPNWCTIFNILYLRTKCSLSRGHLRIFSFHSFVDFPRFH